jgi:hypothetical protein
LIQSWTRALNHVRYAANTPTCTSELCAAARWQLWARRNSGCYLNGDWYCSEDCLNVALARLLVQLPEKTEHTASAHTLPLGLLMLARGAIDESQLKLALSTQAGNPHLRIGQCLCELGLVSETEITRALGAQHSLPVLSTSSTPDDALPLAIMESSRCLGFRGIYQSGLLYLGYDMTIDRSLIAAAETVLDCLCEPCIVSSSWLDGQLETRRRQKTPNEMVFETHSSESEVLRIIDSYLQQLRADQLRVAATNSFLWAKVSGVRTLDLLFRS